MQGFPALNVFLNVFIGVAAVISALVILLTMYTTVTERTRQIGIMKSLGMSNAAIGWIITQEALLISLFGVIGGVLLTFVLRFALTRVTTLEVEMSASVILLTLVVGLIGGALGALYPAMRAARLDAAAQEEVVAADGRCGSNRFLDWNGCSVTALTACPRATPYGRCRTPPFAKAA